MGGKPTPLANPILFVTQVPVVQDYLTIGSPFGNHQGTTRACARGGDLMILYPNGRLRNLTREAGYGVDGVQTENAISVREPCVHWNGNRAVFSMVVGGPQHYDETTQFYWQIYEVVGLGPNDTPVITRVPFQDPQTNNISPVYASDDRILFTTDRTRTGERHLYPQLDEYEEAPTNTGLWSLNPFNGDYFMMNHSPSGAFSPLVDSFGRVVFVRWDHLERDQQTDLENMGLGNYGTFNYSDESANAYNTGNNEEVFPEARRQWTDYVNQNPDYDGYLNGYEPHLVGHESNHFFLWQINQDGTVEETLNHTGRHELHVFIDKNRNDDNNIVNKAFFPNWVANNNPIDNFFQVSEDPLLPGVYYGIDARLFDTHGAGQVIMMHSPEGLNADEVRAFYITHRETKDPTLDPTPNHSGLYRNPIRIMDGRGVVVHTPETRKDFNEGTHNNPISRYDFRLKFLRYEPANGFMTAGEPLTNGIRKSVTWFDPYNQINYDGELWELDPVEVRPRERPPEPTMHIDGPELDAIANANVSPTELFQYLRSNDLALIVSRNVTSRDRGDRQQPYNLRVVNGSTETVVSSGDVYDVKFLQLFQGDQIRGLTNGGSQPIPGRRVLAQPLHDPAAKNPPLPNAPPGSVRIAADGSMAAVVPARRAMSWQLTDAHGDGVVRERYWVSFQPGELRTCTTCHGLNSSDQALRSPPTNTPQALTLLLQYLKTQDEL